MERQLAAETLVRGIARELQAQRLLYGAIVSKSKGVRWSNFPVDGYPGKVFSGVFIG